MRFVTWMMSSCLVVAMVACADDPSPAGDAGVLQDAGRSDAGSEPECYPTPTRHQELINACTTAQHVDKTPVLPLLNADGTLPPLP